MKRKSIKTLLLTFKPQKRSTVFFLLVVLVFVVPGNLMAMGSEGETAPKTIGIMVTTLPLADFVENIGKERVKVDVLVPPGASPHTYEPTPSQLRKVSSAKMFVKVGSGVEFELRWVDKLIAINQEMLVVDTSRGVKMLGTDPHIWLSPLNAGIQVENIYLGLIRIDPKNKDYYNLNKEKYLIMLNKLDQEIRDKLARVRSRKFIVFHPAWGYFAKEYGLEQIGIEIDGKEPSAGDIKRLIDMAGKDDIKIIFASPQFNPESAEVIAHEIGGRVVFIDPLSKNYPANIRKLLTELICGLK